MLCSSKRAQAKGLKQEGVCLLTCAGSLLSPSPEAAVVGGNVLTSQRVTDVVLKAFNACAASQVRSTHSYNSGCPLPSLHIVSKAPARGGHEVSGCSKDHIGTACPTCVGLQQRTCAGVLVTSATLASYHCYQLLPGTSAAALLEPGAH